MLASISEEPSCPVSGAYTSAVTRQSFDSEVAGGTGLAKNHLGCGQDRDLPAQAL